MRKLHFLNQMITSMGLKLINKDGEGFFLYGDEYGARLQVNPSYDTVLCYNHDNPLACEFLKSIKDIETFINTNKSMVIECKKQFEEMIILNLVGLVCNGR